MNMRKLTTFFVMFAAGLLFSCAHQNTTPAKKKQKTKQQKKNSEEKSEKQKKKNKKKIQIKMKVQKRTNLKVFLMQKRVLTLPLNDQSKLIKEDKKAGGHLVCFVRYQRWKCGVDFYKRVKSLKKSSFRDFYITEKKLKKALFFAVMWKLVEHSQQRADKASSVMICVDNAANKKKRNECYQKLKKPVQEDYKHLKELKKIAKKFNKLNLWFEKSAKKVFYSLAAMEVKNAKKLNKIYLNKSLKPKN